MTKASGVPVQVDRTAAGPADDGEMGALIHSMDWSRTTLGPMADWSSSLRTAVSACLESPVATVVCWGPDLVVLYNDAYARFVPGKAPAFLGRRAQDCWPTAWAELGPRLERVLGGGEATWSDNQPMKFVRRELLEEAWFSYSHSPISDEVGGVSGVLCQLAETTAQMLGERRLYTVQRFAEETAAATTAEDVCVGAARALVGAGEDLPFVLFYLAEPSGTRAQLAGAAGLPGDTAAAPRTISLAPDEGEPVWPVGAVLRSGQPEHLKGLPERFGALCVRDGQPLVRDARVLPLVSPGDAQPTGVMIAGLSPHLPFDDHYRRFLEVVARNVGARLRVARAQSEADSQREAAQEAERRKDEFLAMLAHELRTPLMALTTALAVRDRKEKVIAGDSQAVMLRDTCKSQVQNLARMVEDLLDVSRVTSGKLELQARSLDLNLVIQRAVQSVRALFDSRNHALLIDLAPGPTFIHADPTRLEQVLCNLLLNAARYTAPGGRIELRLDREAGGWIAIHVKDTGIGISAQMLDQVFELFVQVDAPLHRAEGGLGIGLTVVKRIVELHGGTVSAHSDGRDRGSEFIVRIPAMGGTVAPEAIPFRAMDSKPMPGRRVLLVEDDKEIREVLKLLLEELGHQVQTADNGLTAVDRILELRPDVALVDVGLPGIDGYEVARRVRASPAGAGLFLVAVTGYGGPRAKARSMEAGFDHHVVKPIDPDTLDALLVRPT
jgi:signal transduction histidine kinase